MITELRARNILSFGPDAPSLGLRRLNVLIGPNGSGKSNLIEILSLFQSCPRELAVPIREGGGVRDWLWKGTSDPDVKIEAVIEHADKSIRHCLWFRAAGNRLEVARECIEDSNSDPSAAMPYYYDFSDKAGRARLNVAGGAPRTLEAAELHPEKSILAQVRDPHYYPEITTLAEYHESIRLYRDWSFARNTGVRTGQSADLPSDFLAEDASNLAIVLSTLRRTPDRKAALVNDLQQLYAGITDYDTIVEGGKIQLYINENGQMIPATRLSDGTLRYLSLLTILHHPTPPPLVAIEEPELGLHPDVLPRLADRLREASARMQLVVTTHSEVLVDAMTDTPEVVVVTERSDAGTSFSRLRHDDLREWLKKYSLGQLWTRGDLGGTRW
jgi:predicted ATPase